MVIMIIKHIIIQDFGSVRFYDTTLTSELNIVDTRYIPEISAVIGLFLCSKARHSVPPTWIRPTTRLTAEILMDTTAYVVDATPNGDHLNLVVMDADGNDATKTYRNRIFHCQEQDAMESFDGQDKTLPLRLCWYRNCSDAPVNVSSRTASLSDTKTFQSQLIRYIRTFQPEPINCIKDYKAVINSQGRFEVFYPGVFGEVSLSTTEEKLFLYICFLNVAEFWEDIEKLRDIHYEKKPIVIRNFFEFLDESTDISGLVTRTLELQRQIIILTPPMGEEIKEKWIGKQNE